MPISTCQLLQSLNSSFYEANCKSNQPLMNLFNLLQVLLFNLTSFSPFYSTFLHFIVKKKKKRQQNITVSFEGLKSEKFTTFKLTKKRKKENKKLNKTKIDVFIVHNTRSYSSKYCSINKISNPNYQTIHNKHINLIKIKLYA